MKQKIIKNPDAPRGRVDNLNRTERVRLSLTEARALMLKELFESFRRTHPREWTPEYEEFYNDILQHIESLRSNLLVEVNVQGTLF